MALEKPGKLGHFLSYFVATLFQMQVYLVLTTTLFHRGLFQPVKCVFICISVADS